MIRFIYLFLTFLALAGGSASRAQTQADSELLSLGWDQIEQQARGGVVTFFSGAGQMPLIAMSQIILAGFCGTAMTSDCSGWGSAIPPLQ